MARADERQTRRGTKGLTGGAVVALVIAANMAVSLLAVFVLPDLAGVKSTDIVYRIGVAAAAFLLVAELAAAMLFPGIRAVARQTFAQCVRMKVAAAIIILLVAALALLPFLLKGDNTLSGRIRTFLGYGTGLTAILLSISTVFLAVGVVSGDVADKRIFLVATKPVSRWQYILGRWMGVVLLDVLLLAVVAVGMYAVAQYLRTEDAGGPGLKSNDAIARDRRVVETEIFAARAKISPVPIDVKPRVQERIDLLRRQGRYAEVIEGIKARYSLDDQAAHVKLMESIEKEEKGKAQSVAPGGILSWRFTGIDVGAENVTGNAVITHLRPREGLFRFRAEPAMLGRLIPASPVLVRGESLLVEAIGKDFFVARVMFPERAYELRRLKPDDEVEVTVEPPLQIASRISSALDPPGNTVRGIWMVGNPRTKSLVRLPARNTLVRTNRTITVPGRLAEPNGEIEVSYMNLPRLSGFATSVQIPEEEVSLLYQVGSFEWNFLRAFLLLVMQMMFLAGLGVFAGSFLSFPVGCLMSFSLLPLSLARGYINEAMDWMTDLGAVMWLFGKLVLGAARVFLPDFGSMSASDSLVDGMHLSWTFTGETALWVVALRAVLLLGAAFIIFHRRELARVQV